MKILRRNQLKAGTAFPTEYLYQACPKERNHIYPGVFSRGGTQLGLSLPRSPPAHPHEHSEDAAAGGLCRDTRELRPGHKPFCQRQHPQAPPESPRRSCGRAEHIPSAPRRGSHLWPTMKITSNALKLQSWGVGSKPRRQPWT